ncbi:hypothetical protein LZ554_004769 [Drepanopeziza brunnea f. sp. 'monogermtubi']|nr:hypothetical protein LZ554_004769 [Drepanopeziza brunnea f. sp. 'monogermtubi']
MPLPKSIFATLLTLSFLFNGAQAQGWPEWLKKPNSFQWPKTPKLFQPEERIVIGYAAVSRWAATSINEFRELWVDDSPHNLQLGPGVYLSNTAGNWINQPQEESWFCVVKAKKSKIKSAPKVYIPHMYEQLTPEHGFVWRELWGKDEAVIVEYIRSEAFIKKPKEALRFSWVKDTRTSQLQMVVPTGVVNDNGLDIWAQCFESENELKQVSDKTVDWEAWKIKGNPGVLEE